VNARDYIVTRTAIEDLVKEYARNPANFRVPYKVIFADAVLFHIDAKIMPSVLSWFNDVLAPDGYLFANFKINDHTLVSLDGRFFEYYETAAPIERMLRDAGFKIDDLTLTLKDASMYGGPYPTQWAHFICSKNS
jgi:hypothetical protein